ncbi:MAG: hypothetical protein ABI586_09695, partial [Candidatus Nanopelagicales bacterium]
MSVLHARPMAALVATALGAVLLPLALVSSTAAADTGAAAHNGVAQVVHQRGIPGPQVALRRAKAALVGRGHARDLTLTLRDLSARLPQLAGRDRKVAEALLARPNGGHDGLEKRIGAKWPGNEANNSPACSVIVPVCVHWTNSSRHQPPPRDEDTNGNVDCEKNGDHQ